MAKEKDCNKKIHTLSTKKASLSDSDILFLISKHYSYKTRLLSNETNCFFHIMKQFIAQTFTVYVIPYIIHLFKPVLSSHRIRNGHFIYAQTQLQTVSNGHIETQDRNTFLARIKIAAPLSRTMFTYNPHINAAKIFPVQTIVTKAEFHIRTYV